MTEAHALAALGWDDDWSALFATHAAAGLVPGRVVISHRGAHDVATAVGELRCDVRSRLYEEASSTADLPVVGDWVALSTHTDGLAGTVEAVLPRRTRVSRQAGREQVLAANVDVVFVATSIDQGLDLLWLERYLVLGRQSGARVAVLLTKADLHPDPAAAAAAATVMAGDAPVLPVSSREGLGLEAVRALLPAGSTAVIIGPSGAGKSTLANTFLGEEMLATGAVQRDGQGRHTTTRREVVRLPWGALLIDTPGIRNLQLWVADAGLDETFPDVVALFEHCRFADCAHDREPGCAVKKALADGSLAPERWANYHALESEVAELGRRLEARTEAEARRGRRR